MHPDDLRNLLSDVATGRVAPDAAEERLRRLPIEHLGFAQLDHHRSLRCGVPEVIFGEGKTPDQLVEIFDRLAAAGDGVLATRVAPEAAARVRQRHPASEHDPLARVVMLRRASERRASAAHAVSTSPSATASSRGGSDFVAVCAAGTSDLPVAEEARLTLEFLGCPTAKFYDVGVAGLHRLLGQADELRRARVVIVVAGMEGALPSVVGGLVAAPLIAVPTNIGYGASFGGLAALLAMMNSCAAGVTVVNINNGFGAGVAAAKIWQLEWRISKSE